MQRIVRKLTKRDIVKKTHMSDYKSLLIHLKNQHQTMHK